MINKMKCMFSRLAAQFLKPTLALLAACIVGGLTGSAMAADASYETIWSQNFDNPNYLSSSDYTGNWSNTRPIVTREGITTTGDGENSVSLTEVYKNTDSSTSYCLTFCGSSRNTIRGAYYTFPSDVFADLSDYVFSFDFYMTGGGYLNVTEAGGGAFSFIALTGSSLNSTSEDDLVVIHTAKDNADGYSSLYLAKDWVNTATYWNDCTASLAANSAGGLLHATRGNAPNVQSPGTAKYWHRVKIVANQTDGLYVTVTRLVDSKELLSNVYVGSFKTLQQLNVVSKVGHVAEYIAFDNFVLQAPKVAGAPEKPVITGDGSGKEKTAVTITTETEGASIYYWIGENNEANKILYSGTFELEESGTVFAYAENNGITSATVSQYFDSNLQAITLLAPVINRRGFKHVYISAPQTSVYGNPTPTIMYKINSDPEYTEAPAGVSAVVTSSALDAFGVLVTAKSSNALYSESNDSTYTTPTLLGDGYVIWNRMDFMDIIYGNSGGTSWTADTYTSSATGTETTYKGLKFGDTVLSGWLWYLNGDYTNTTNPRWTVSGGGLSQDNVGNQPILIKDVPAGSYVYINGTTPKETYNVSDVSINYINNISDEKVYYCAAGGDCVFAYARYANIFAVCVYSPLVASVDGQPYATLQGAADAAAEGATITMTGSTTDGVSLKRGQVLVVGDNSCGTVSGATQYISVSYNETTKSWTAVETATWKGGAGNWNLESSWNTGVVPSRYTEVVISNAGDDYINVYLTAGAECKAMNISGKVYFSQENAATTVHNAIAMYGNITGTGTIKLVHTGFANSSEAAITIAPDIVIADPGVDSDSWISGGNITMSGSVTVERKFVIWGANNTFSGSLIFSSNAHLGCWGDGVKGLVFNNVSITSGEGANIWLGTDKSQSSISGTGCTLSGSLRINTDNGTTISAPVTLNNNASLVVTDGGTISSVAAANATYLVADSTSDGLKTYTANAAPLVVNNVGYSTLANAWNAAGNDNNAAWIYVYASLPQEDTVKMTAVWQKLRVVPGEYSIDGHVLLASTLENVALKKDVGAEMTEYTAYPTVKVTVTPGAGVASGTIENASSYIEKSDNVYTVYSGAQVTITWTAAEGYEFAGGETTATTDISPTENVTPECPTATLIPTGDVSISAPIVGGYGNDFATVTVTAGVTSTYPAATTITYTLKANGTAIATKTAAGDATSVTFDNANVSSLTRYGNISYTVEASGDNVTAATSDATTAMFADTIGWVKENYQTTTTAAAGGAWQTAVAYDATTHKAAVVDNRFSATNCTTGDVVTVTIDDVVYTGLSDLTSADTDAQGAVAVGGTETAPKFMLLTKKNDTVGWYEAAGVTPVLENGVYDIVMTFDYISNTYTVTVNNTPLTVDNIAAVPLAKSQTSVKDIDFLGAGSLAAINGVQYEGKMAIDQNGRKYATVAEALEANASVKGAVIKLLHGSATTSAEGWNFDNETKTFVKKVIGLIFLAF